jgi:hypothetical protein
MDVAGKYQEQLHRLKKDVRNTHTYWKPNYDTFNTFRRFVFDTSLTADDKMVLDALKKPQIEFNILEAYISRLRGEFSKQEPSVIITADDGSNIDAATLEVVKGHLKHIFFQANKDGCEYAAYTDILSGGFSALKVWTEYANEMSFDQVIKFDRVYDPTLVGFDPLARLPHKGDGRFAFELFPKSRIEFEEDYPDIDLSGVDFTRAVEGFNWSYSNDQEDILLICDFYEKKRRNKKIVKLANGHVMTMKDYEEFLMRWEKAGMFEQPPGISGKPRWTDIETICRYRFIENKVLSYKETNFKRLPLVYMDGNSILLRESNSGAFIQKTRPYVYHAKGMQQLKNFAGQTLANELENMVQHKFKVAKESLPDEQSYLDAYTNIQIANTLVYKAFKDNDPKIPVPPPTEINRIPAPPEVINTFSITDQMAQSILGSYDASLGINDNQLSGTAIVEGATQSNSAAMPYVVSFMQALTQVANIIVELIPKYYVTPRTLPVVKDDGSRDYQKVNQQPGPFLNYDENSLDVKVEAGINFAVQKSKGLSQIIAMTQASPIFAQFINAKGLKVILDYFDIDGKEKLKELADQFMQEQAQAQQMQQQQQQEAMKNNPMLIKAQTERMKAMADVQVDQAEVKIDAAKVSIEKQKADLDFMKVLMEMKSDQATMMANIEKADAEKTRAAVDLAIKAISAEHQQNMDEAEHHHQKMMDIATLGHEINESKKEKKE